MLNFQFQLLYFDFWSKIKIIKNLKYISSKKIANYFNLAIFYEYGIIITLLEKF